MSRAANSFRNATLYTDDKKYRIVRAPATAILAGAAILAELAEPFSALIADKDEITLILPADVWSHVASRLPEHATLPDDYRLITFDLVLESDLVGFMALVSRLLAEAGVSILPVAAYSRDHILVSDNQFLVAWDTLRGAQSK